MQKTLTIHTDGGSRGNPGDAAIGVVISDGGETLHTHKAFLGTQTNNVAEYEALLYAVGWVSRFCDTAAPQMAQFLLDSKLVVEQVNGNWKIKEAHLRELAIKIQTILRTLPCPIEIKHIPRAQNAAADALVNECLDER